MGKINGGLTMVVSRNGTQHRPPWQNSSGWVTGTILNKQEEKFSRTQRQRDFWAEGYLTNAETTY
jgi:hypothetical protein